MGEACALRRRFLRGEIAVELNKKILMIRGNRGGRSGSATADGKNGGVHYFR